LNKDIKVEVIINSRYYNVSSDIINAMNALALIIKIIGYLWIVITMIIIIIGYIAIVYEHGILELQDTLSPFNIGNVFLTVIIFAPGFILIYIANRIEDRSQ